MEYEEYPAKRKTPQFPMNQAEPIREPAMEEETYEPRVLRLTSLRNSRTHFPPIRTRTDERHRPDVDERVEEGDMMHGDKHSSDDMRYYDNDVSEKTVSQYGSPLSRQVAMFVLVSSICLLILTLFSGFFGVFIGGMVNLGKSSGNVLLFIVTVFIIAADCLCHAGLFATGLVGLTSAKMAFNEEPSAAITRRYELARMFVRLLMVVAVFYISLSILRAIPGLLGALLFSGNLSTMIGLFVSTGALLCLSVGIFGYFIFLGLLQVRIVRRDLRLMNNELQKMTYERNEVVSQPTQPALG